VRASLAKLEAVRWIKRGVRRLLAPVRARMRMAPAKAFDLWSTTYDEQIINPFLLIDDDLVARLLADIPLEGKVVVDVGCGSGRLWPRLLAARPSHLIGYDASAGMLERLRAKHPDAELHRVTGHLLPGTQDESCDLVISTLTFGYIADAEGAFREWARVLKPAGHVVLTDIHPDAATRDSRCFKHGDRIFAIQHHIRSLTSLAAAATRGGLSVTRTEDGLVGEAAKPAYEAADALAHYGRQQGTALMFGMRLVKPR
jgi:SAM-dependent methyltransferase